MVLLYVLHVQKFHCALGNFHFISQFVVQSIHSKLGIYLGTLMREGTRLSWPAMLLHTGSITTRLQILKTVSREMLDASVEFYCGWYNFQMAMLLLVWVRPVPLAATSKWCPPNPITTSKQPSVSVITALHFADDCSASIQGKCRQRLCKSWRNNIKKLLPLPAAYHNDARASWVLN